MSDRQGILCAMTEDADPRDAAELLKSRHEDPVTILYRIRNHRVDYSIVNRPDPTLSKVTDALLLGAIIYAGGAFAFKRVPSLAEKDAIDRDDGDGRTVRYRESIEIDWHAGTIEGSKSHDLTLQVLGVVVQQLSHAVVEALKPPQHTEN
jgi:hypothetical protein